MRQLSVDRELFKSTKNVRCPKCNFEFNLMFSRAKACVGCRDAVLGCDWARCPRCDCEFSLKRLGLTLTKAESKRLREYMAKALLDYHKFMGEKPTR